MIIKVTTTITTEKEINFPYLTYDSYLETYYYNYKEKSCIIINSKKVEHLEYTNFGLEYPEAKQQDCFKVMDQTILTITEALNK